MNYKHLKDAQAFTTSRWTESLDAWKKAQDDKEVAYKAFLKNLTESHYYGYMNLPENGENIEYDHSFFTISLQDGSKNFISVYTSMKELESSIAKPETSMEGRKVEAVEVNYAFLAKELTLADVEQIDGIVINPFSDDYILTREELVQISKRLCIGLNNTEDLGNITPANIFIKEVWKIFENSKDDDKRAEIFSHMMEAFEDALFALPIIVRKEDLEEEDGNTYIIRTDADLAIRMLTSEANGDQANIVPIFTSQEDIETLDGWNAEDEERKALLMTADLETHLGGLNNGENFDALVINPFTDNIVLTKEILAAMGLVEGEE
ncbi:MULTISPECIES: SseB family protein [unclassified Catenibacterium]|uniref:SseB family protein n=1 Tax=unclassified Catenibacterium TaxID=2643636 RepID=UPI001314139C|nr:MULTISPECIES: SseB family protein [unclassified Catenibacterium]